MLLLHSVYSHDNPEPQTFHYDNIKVYVSVSYCISMPWRLMQFWNVHTAHVWIYLFIANRWTRNY